MKILVTGGAGYIGSHTCVELLNNGYEVVIVDNLCNSNKESVARIEKITGKKVKFYQFDMLDKLAVDSIFKKEKITGVIHFAGLKAVGESVAIPLTYYNNNLNSTLNLLEAMIAHDVKNIVFSSSATVYGNPKTSPIDETFPTGGVSNPYGRTKYIIEEILRDVQHIHPEMNVTILRYFNPIGAHESGLIGEDANGIPNNLIPYMTKVAIGKLPQLGVFGNDYKTPDGTCIRDYIHVVDLAKGHLAALAKMEANPGLIVYNLGTGKGTSVLEIIHAFERANNLKIPYVIKERRPGDLDAYYADCQKAKRELGWEAKLTVEDACRDSWRWQQKNPHGFEK